MSKINTSDATTLTNETSFISLYNANNALIETASDTFLSRDGTSPNSMSASLDMNSNRIINLPTPVLSNDVVRLQDMVTFTGGGTIAAIPTTSAELRGIITDETGTGSLVFSTNPTFNSGTVTITPTAASLTQGLVVTQSGPTGGSQAGTSTNAAGQGQPSFAYNSIFVNGEAANITGGSPSYTLGTSIAMVTGGTNSQGQKNALGVQLLHNTASAPSSTRDHVAIQAFAIDSVGDGGTNTGAGSNGTVFGGGFLAHALSGATNLTAVVGAEFDTQIETGATSKWRFGCSSVGGGAIRGASIDAAYEIGATSASAAFLTGLTFSSIHGGAPIATTGTLIGTDGTSFTITKGIDLSAVTVTGNFITGPQSKFLINSVGTVTAGDGTNNIGIVANGKASGTAGGGIMGVQNASTYVIAMANASNILGGAYDATPMLYSGTTLLKFYVSGTAMQLNSISTSSTSSTTGTLLVTGGLGVSENVSIGGSLSRGAPVTKTNDFTLATTENWLIANKAGTITVTLPAASAYAGREVYFKTLQAQTVVSATSNVCPNTTNTPGTAILPATAGAWCQIVSDGTNWIRMASSTIA